MMQDDFITAARHRLTALQIEAILGRLVPVIAAPEDHEFFRGVLRIKFESMNSSQTARFVKRLLTERSPANDA